jgi:hypothetical protein
MKKKVTKKKEKLDEIKYMKMPSKSKKNGTAGKSKAVTFTQEEVAKEIRIAEDKLRTKYSKLIKELEDEIKRLSPKKKLKNETKMERRIADLEESEKAVTNREHKIAVKEQLLAYGLDKALADYLKDDVDIEELAALVDRIVKSRMKKGGYVPSNHSSDDKVTPEEFKKWSYSRKEKFAQEHPGMYRRLMGKK